MSGVKCAAMSFLKEKWDNKMHGFPKKQSSQEFFLGSISALFLPFVSGFVRPHIQDESDSWSLGYLPLLYVGGRHKELPLILF